MQLSRGTRVVLLVGGVTGALAVSLLLAAAGGFPGNDPNASWLARYASFAAREPSPRGAFDAHSRAAR